MFTIYLLSFLFLALAAAHDPNFKQPSNTCDPKINDGMCSKIPYCRCEATVVGERICTRQTNCSYAEPCDSNGRCAQPRKVCVVDSRCDNRPLCYNSVLFGENLCPLLGKEINNRRKRLASMVNKINCGPDTTTDFMKE
jgi:hypothetical protein